IIVAAGSYDEQVVITKSLTLQGEGDTTIVQPSSAAKLTIVLSGYFNAGTKQIAGIVVANVADGSNVTVKDLKVDGDNVTTKPTGADYVAGIFYRETGGTIDTVTVVDMTVGATGTAVRGYGAYLSAITNTVSVEVKGSTITNYDKNGIDAHGDKLTADIHNNTITGRGPLPGGDEVQNGVNIMDWATGTVNNNTISNMAYAPLTWLASGILFFHNGGTANGNTITDCQLGVIFQDGNATAEDNTIDGGTVGVEGLGWQRNPGFTGTTFTVSFVGNTISSINDIGGMGGYAIAVRARPGFNCTLEVDSNQLTGSEATAADGVYVGAAAAGSVVATITNNAISGWEYGMRLVRAVASGSRILGNTISNNTISGIYLADTVMNHGNVNVNFNNIIGNQTYGVNTNGGTGVLNAENNWWGAASGPYHPSLNPTGSGDTVSDNVNFTPWLTGSVSSTYTVSVNSTGTYVFALKGSDVTPVTLNITGLTGSGNITASATNAKHPNAPTDYFISRYFTITKDPSISAITTDITLSYTAADSTDANLGPSHRNVDMAKYSGGIWTYITPTGGYDANLAVYTATVTGQTALSDWTVSGPGGVPAELSRFETVIEPQQNLRLEH
ncbi:MAG: right-handed parallel beta-helix repeat-containing protein, partial [bacterium]|nr:right-handed parallel beta-helix repeat-containing protein [bacterium]